MYVFSLYYSCIINCIKQFSTIFVQKLFPLFYVQNTISRENSAFWFYILLDGLRKSKVRKTVLRTFFFLRKKSVFLNPLIKLIINIALIDYYITNIGIGKTSFISALLSDFKLQFLSTNDDLKCVSAEAEFLIFDDFDWQELSVESVKKIIGQVKKKMFNYYFIHNSSTLYYLEISLGKPLRPDITMRPCSIIKRE